MVCTQLSLNNSKQTWIYSIPRFAPIFSINYHLVSSTAPVDFKENYLFSKYIQALSLNSPVIPFSRRFIHVNRLILNGLTLPSMDSLISSVDLNSVRELDLAEIKMISIGKIHLLIEHIPNLKHLLLEKFIPLFIPPLHMDSLTIHEWEYQTNIDQFCSRFAHIKFLEIDVQSVKMMMKLIKRLKCLEHVVFKYNIDKYLPFLSGRWLKRVFCRLRRDKFTYRTADYSLHLSIAKKQNMKKNICF